DGPFGEPELSEPVIQLRESEPGLPAHAEPRFEPFEPLAPLEPLEPLDPPKSDPVAPPAAPAFLSPSSTSFSPAPVSSPGSSSSGVWPIGLACLVGIAVGFGVGYTVGVRDRISAGQPAAGPPSAPPAAAASPFIESPVVNRPAPEPKADNERRLLPEDRAPVVPFSGRVVVRSTPAGARVFVDGRDRGQAPATVTDLGQGEHRVRLVQEGYLTAE